MCERAAEGAGLDVIDFQGDLFGVISQDQGVHYQGGTNRCPLIRILSIGRSAAYNLLTLLSRLS